MTRSMMNGHEVWVRARHFVGTSSCGVGFDGSEFKPIDDSSGFDIFTALLFPLTSAEVSGIWCTTAKSKMKSWCCVCDSGTAYRGSAARQSNDVGS